MTTLSKTQFNSMLDSFINSIDPPKSATEQVAAWMIENGIATGHGDTLGDLLAQIELHGGDLAAVNKRIAELEAALEPFADCLQRDGELVVVNREAATPNNYIDAARILENKP